MGGIMCTAISIKDKEHYFGRTLDLEHSYGEGIMITSQSYPLRYRHGETDADHYAIIGTAIEKDGFPLYFEAANEKGLGGAGLNFADYAFYHPVRHDKRNIESFELIPWVLSQCKNIDEVIRLIEKTNICGDVFDSELGAPTLHWIFSDGDASLVVESVKEGLRLYRDECGVLTNSPEFSFHKTNLNNYISLSAVSPQNRSEIPSLAPYSRGMGAIGLPGDCSSASRYVRAVFNKFNSTSGESEEDKVCRFFHILGSVEQIEGCVRLDCGKTVRTVYTSCINTSRGIFYYCTYNDRAIRAVSMSEKDKKSKELIFYPMSHSQTIISDKKC